MRLYATECDPSVSPDCPGHSPTDKFPDCLIGALYFSGSDECTGDVDGFGWWVGLYLCEKAETIDDGTGVKVAVPAGTYAVITEDDRGFIGFDLYSCAESAQRMFDAWEADYGLYCEQSDSREERITSSTGRVGR